MSLESQTISHCIDFKQLKEAFVFVRSECQIGDNGLSKMNDKASKLFGVKTCSVILLLKIQKRIFCCNVHGSFDIS